MTLQRLLSLVRSAVQEYDMISCGDRVAVGVSGGKDSLALLVALAHLRRFYPKSFVLHAFTVDMGFDPPADFSSVAALCRELEVEYTVIPTQLYRLIFQERREPNPCALCAKMRRGALANAAVAAGCNKLALGHHADDLIDTFMLNMLYAGSLSTFSPVTPWEKSGLMLIRPMLHVWEKELSGFLTHYPLPVVPSACPADKATRRQEVKELLAGLEKNNRDLKAKLYGALRRAGISGLQAPSSKERL